MAILPACDHRAAIAPKAPDAAAQIHGAAQAQGLMGGGLWGDGHGMIPGWDLIVGTTGRFYGR